jgi:hypothetical protein
MAGFAHQGDSELLSRIRKRVNCMMENGLVQPYQHQFVLFLVGGLVLASALAAGVILILLYHPMMAQSPKPQLVTPNTGGLSLQTLLLLAGTLLMGLGLLAGHLSGRR